MKAIALSLLGLSLLPGSCFGPDLTDPIQRAVERLVARFDVPSCSNAKPLRAAGESLRDENGKAYGNGMTWSYLADDACLAALEAELGAFGFVEMDSGTYLLEGGESWSDEVSFGRAANGRPGNLHWKYSTFR